MGVLRDRYRARRLCWYTRTMNDVRYVTSVAGITTDHLGGFFAGWHQPPSPEQHLKLLHNSDHIVLALHKERVVGFSTAISDGTLAAYIPFLEVLPAWQRQGIGSELVSELLALLSDHYMIDLVCDPELQTFYERFAMERATGMRIRNYEHQSGR
mgnify:CR=1 FL=1